MPQNKYTAARRSIGYVMKTTIIIAVILLLAIAAVLMAMNMSNIYIISTEGMNLRVENILQQSDSGAELTEYFTTEFLMMDEKLNSKPYANYTIINYDYRMNIESISVSPWGRTAKMQIIERLASISGSIKENAKPQNAPEDATYPLPEWVTVRAVLTFTQINGRWYITSMEVLEENPALKQKATPDYSQIATPTPLVTLAPVTTPTPAPTVTPAA